MGFDEWQDILIKNLNWLGVSLAQSLQMSLVGLAYGLIKPKGIWSPLVLGALWIVLEWAQGYGELAMVWGRLALSQYNFAPIIQSASLFGSLFVSFLIICVNGLIALYLWLLINQKISKKSLYIAAALVFLVNLCFGYTRIAVVNSSIKKSHTVPIAAVQADLPADIKWSLQKSEIFKMHYDLTVDAINNGAKVIIWPETIILTALEYSMFYDDLKNLVNDKQITLIVGSYNHDEEGNSYNALYCLDYAIQDYQVYRKRQLVPLGEFVPYQDLLNKFKFLEKFNLFENDVNPGKEAVVFNTSYGDFSGLICFDSIFQRFSYESVQRGAQVLFIGTNDSWYLGTAAIQQHYGHAVLRAVENNRFVVRAANAGVSGIISCTGKTIKELGSRKTGYIMYEVPLINQKSLYAITGDIIAYIALASAIVAFAYFRLLHNKKLFSNAQKNLLTHKINNK